MESSNSNFYGEDKRMETEDAKGGQSFGGDSQRKPRTGAAARFISGERSTANAPRPAAATRSGGMNQMEIETSRENPNISTSNAMDERPIGGVKPPTFDMDELPVGGGQKIGFDELPIGGGAKSKMMMEEYPPDYDPNAQAQDAGNSAPLGTRLKSKIWKTRQGAFEELTTLIENASDESEYSEHSSEFITFVSDANPGAQEKALLLVKAFLEKAKRLHSIDPKDLSKVLLDKCFSRKAQARKLAGEIIVPVSYTHLTLPTIYSV
eukprot:TRINITY_DN24676_c0_g1_i1.p1 TRINITY_DN24676_c0_g1~~TRINITY_DN24676_c0_g1_i1.p1  ORF type:complete len:265 (+),score=66.64 TRINITY_DN24676_c0_g1_i1:19-813(+)